MEEIENQAESNEEEYELALRQAQARKQEVVESISEEVRSEIESLIPLVKNKKKLLLIAPIALWVAVAVDGGTAISVILETILAVPSVGAIAVFFEAIKDLLDLSAGGVLMILFWPVGGGNIKFIIMLVEAVAVVIKLLPWITGAIPTLIIATCICIWLVSHKAKKAKKQIAELKKVDPDQISEEVLEEEFA